MNQAKPFMIPKKIVWEAYKRVKQNDGAYGVDEQSLQDFERNLKDNLYKLWNRLSSGSYFPDPVRTVEIPKKDGGTRPLGIPTVTDRIAQMVVKITLEPKVEPHFHPDSYGYRPKKSAIKALGIARQRCWRYAWVLDVDIKGFFENLDHELLMKAVGKYTDSKWILLYIDRWLKAPSQSEDGILTSRTKGTPQGGVISPLLANIYLHHAFDKWISQYHPYTFFERYADDIVVHCRKEERAVTLRIEIEEQLAAWKLELHPQKTKIVYCRNGYRNGDYPIDRFEFLGYTFRPRPSKNQKGELFLSFSPAASDRAIKNIRSTMRNWRLYRNSTVTLKDIAQEINPILRGWLGYYGCYNKSVLNPVFRQLDFSLMKWAMWKHKRLAKQWRKAIEWLKKTRKHQPDLFAHWPVFYRAGRTIRAV